MEIKSSTEQGATVVEVGGRLDAGTAAEFDHQCQALIGKGPTRMVINFKALEYISSAGLRCLLTLTKKLRATGGSLALCNLSGVVREVVAISGFESFMPVFDSVDAAIQGKK